MNSSTGTAQTYEAGDQRTQKSERNLDSHRFNEGQPNAHSDTDSKDQRSLANRLESAATRDSIREEQESAHSKHFDPLAPAQAHGNKPSRGAQVDAELQKADEEELKNKGKI
ncbi:hypothetical protein C8Q75DRAFT_240870 [Abortiporus biennis]|nr:hypothetical protein C8Q75DRAFT_240870 [Abortiporus biennis]